MENSNVEDNSSIADVNFAIFIFIHTVLKLFFDCLLKL